MWLAGRRLVAIDGMCLDVADTTANTAHFGRPGVNKGEQAAFPQTRVVALAECGTRAVFAAEIGRYSQSEATLTELLLDRLEPGMLLLADRGFFSYALWRKAIGTGAELLWRVRTDKNGPMPTHIEDLPDGSWLAHLRRTTPAAARREEPTSDERYRHARRTNSPCDTSATSAGRGQGLGDQSPCGAASFMFSQA